MGETFPSQCRRHLPAVNETRRKGICPWEGNWERICFGRQFVVTFCRMLYLGQTLRALIVGALLSLSGLGPLAAAESDQALKARIQGLIPRLETYIDGGMKAFDVPGLASGIVAGDELIYAKGFGVRSKSGGEAVSPGTVFQIASTSKAFLATTMAIAVDHGKLHWDDRIIDLAPDFQLKDAWMTGEFRIFDIIAQRSGLPTNVNNTLGYFGFDADAMVRSLRFVDTLSSFRAAFTYTNVTHILAGRIVAAAEGAPDWGSVLTSELFDALGMKNSSYTRAAIEAARDHAQGHRYTLEGSVEIPFTDWIPYRWGGAGAINSTVEDMAQWMRLQLGNGTFQGRALVSPENLAFTRTPKVADTEKEAYAMGWFNTYTPNHPDATLAELKTWLASARQIEVSTGCLWNGLRRLHLPLKKSLSALPSRTGPMLQKRARFGVASKPN